MNRDQISRIVRQVLSEQSEPGPTPLSAAKASGALSPQTNDAAPRVSRAAVLTEKGRLEMREFPIREIAEDEMLVRVEGCGICGTDIHEFKSDPMGLAPLVLGHEGTGEVVRVGAKVRRDSAGKEVRLGDRIVTSVNACGSCDACLYTPGRLNLCEKLKVYGLLPDDETHLNGYFAEYLIVRGGSTFFVVNDLSLELRMLIEPAAVVVHALERAKLTGLVNFRSRVLVQGCGPIGLLMVAAVRAAGVQHIVALDGDDGRLDMAARMGAEHVINYKNHAGIAELVGAVKAATKGRGAHLAFQCTGVPSAAANIWKYVRRGGGICEVGSFVDSGSCAVNPHQDICAKEITLVGSWVYTVEEYPLAYNFLRRAQRIGLPVETLITHRYPLERIEEAFDTNIRQQGLKVAVLPGR